MSEKKYWTTNHKRILMVRQMLNKDLDYVIVSVAPKVASSSCPITFSIQKKLGKYKTREKAQAALDAFAQWNDEWGEA